MNPFALAAFYLLFIASIVVSNIIFAVVLIRGRLVKQRGFLLLLNFAVADVIYAICFFVLTLRLLASVDLSPLGLSALSVLNGPLLLSVVQVNLVVVNVSYVLETRKERLNGSRLVAAVMVASPWLYALLVVTPFAASPLVNMQGAEGLASFHVIIGQHLVSNIIPGFFACIATTLAVASYVTRDRQEGNDGAIEARDATPMDTIAPPQSGSDVDDLPVLPVDDSAIEARDATPMDTIAPPQSGSDVDGPPVLPVDDSAIEARDATAMDTIVPPQSGSDVDDPPVMTSPAEAPAATVDDVTAEPRFPKAEMVYTSVSVGIVQLTIYFTLGIAFSYLSYHNAQALEMSAVVAAFLALLRPAVFSWLWLLRPDYEQTFKRVLRCGSQSQPYSTF